MVKVRGLRWCAVDEEEGMKLVRSIVSLRVGDRIWR